MSTRNHDPIAESLDRLAVLADLEPVGDRMPDIRRRVRAAHRRRGAAVVAAAVVLVLMGAGLWQAMPNARIAPPATTRQTTPWQKISLDAHAEGTDRIAISYTVTGRSTQYADPQTGEPVDYAGPRSVEVLVDGNTVGGSDGGAIACKPGGDLATYTTKFYADKPLVVPVSSTGAHTVVVKAPYCADGQLVPSTRQVVVRTGTADFTTFDRLTTDLDGDGTDEHVALLVPRHDQGQDQVLRVRWGTGETTTATLPHTMETNLLDPVDLDHDGDRELILQGGGGETSLGSVYLADTHALRPVRTVDATGRRLPLRSDADPTAWQTYYGPDGIASYRLTSPATTQVPAPAAVRSWSLTGDTLTRSGKPVARCVRFQPTLTLGPC